jgi:uncharacterized protein YdaU (DUF1376 family)
MRNYEYMPLEVLRLRDSTLAVKASAEEFRAAVLLWCAAWHQVPAGSLPDDDRVLARLAGIDNIRTWKRIREGALHGFSKCSDSRLYHHLICERAADNWESRRGKSRGGKKSGETRRQQAAEKKQNSTEDTSQLCVQENEQRKGREKKGREERSSVPNGTGADAPPPDEDDVWARVFREGKKLLAKKTGCTEQKAGQCIHEVKVASKDSVDEVRRFYIHVRDHSIGEPLSFAKGWAKNLNGKQEHKARDRPMVKMTTAEMDLLMSGEAKG